MRPFLNVGYVDANFGLYHVIPYLQDGLPFPKLGSPPFISHGKTWSSTIWKRSHNPSLGTKPITMITNHLRYVMGPDSPSTPGLMNVGEIQGERSQVLLPGFSADAVTVCRKIMCFAWSFTEVLEGLCAR